MKQWFALMVLAIVALGTPLTGTAQDKGKADGKAKQEAGAQSTDKGKAADKAKSDDKGKSAEIIDINTATAAQLMTMDGIGEARAAAIIKGRPYRGKNELVDKKIVPESVYDKIKDRMIARQAPAKK